MCLLDKLIFTYQLYSVNHSLVIIYKLIRNVDGSEQIVDVFVIEDSYVIYILKYCLYYAKFLI